MQLLAQMTVGQYTHRRQPAIALDDYQLPPLLCREQRFMREETVLSDGPSHLFNRVLAPEGFEDSLFVEVSVHLLDPWILGIQMQLVYRHVSWGKSSPRRWPQ